MKEHTVGAETLRNTEKLGVEEQELNLVWDEAIEGAGETQNSFRLCVSAPLR
jgi:hypothetical protein